MRATRAGQDGQCNGRALAAVDWAARLAEHRPWLWQVIALRLGEDQAVEEVWQEVAAQVCRRPPTLPVPANVGAWLYRVAVRQALVFRRKAGRRRRLIDNCAERVSGVSVGDPLDWLLAAERHRLVRAALRRLPVRDAQVLTLKYVQDWNYHQIAEHLGLSHAAVEARLHRARQRLRTALRSLEPSEDER